MRSDEEILDQLDKLVDQDSNDREIDELRDIVHELLDDRKTALVVVLRDPDASNDYRVFGGGLVEIHDMDAGYSDLRDEDEYKEWKDGHYESAARYEETWPEGAAWIREIADSYDRS